MPLHRHDRRSRESKADSRTAFQRDRDRILYAGAFRRLVGVTQVIGPSDGEVFHNRLTHTLKVAQVGRRMAERFIRNTTGERLAEQWGGIDPDVVEAAALAHDLGHPPFGHIAEAELAKQVKKYAGADSFEGNPQSFRIITVLAARRPGSRFGLDLTRATLDATMKYPWMAKAGTKKFGAYKEDADAFAFAREMHPAEDEAPSAEAQIMDWADDITYSVHDTEDFYRAGLVPLHLLAEPESSERIRFLDRAVKRRGKEKPFTMHGQEVDRKELERIFFKLCDGLTTREAYSGTQGQRGRLDQFTSKMVSDFDRETKLRPRSKGSLCLDRPEEHLLQVALLKELIGVYVFDNPGLAAQEHGQRQVIGNLFKVFYEAAENRQWAMFPAQFRDEAEAILEKKGDLEPVRCARLAADTIATLTDGQALRMHQRLTGQSLGTALDPIMI